MKRKNIILIKTNFMILLIIVLGFNQLKSQENYLSNKRYGIFIGVSDYKHLSDLPNAENDAKAMQLLFLKNKNDLVNPITEPVYLFTKLANRN